MTERSQHSRWQDVRTDLTTARERLGTWRLVGLLIGLGLLWLLTIYVVILFFVDPTPALLLAGPVGLLWYGTFALVGRNAQRRRLAEREHQGLTRLPPEAP